MKMNAPLPLKKGDTIGIAAFARKVSRDEIRFAITTFESWGLKVKLSENLFGECNQFSGTDEQRSSDINQFINDDQVKAIISARGGYGCLRIVDSIDWRRIKSSPKWIIGYSDVTVFSCHLLQKYSTQSIHATMPINFQKNEDALETLRKTLFGEETKYEAAAHELNRNGNCEGVLCGGNLSLLYALQGSESDIDTKGKILFIEDLDEYLYHIDRMILSLKRSGKLNHLKGLIVGGMTDIKDNTIPFGKTAEEIIFDAVKEFNYPVVFNFPAGHIDRNLALIIGGNYHLESSNTVTLKLQPKNQETRNS